MILKCFILLYKLLFFIVQLDNPKMSKLSLRTSLGIFISHCVRSHRAGPGLF